MSDSKSAKAVRSGNGKTRNSQDPVGDVLGLGAPGLSDRQC